MVYLDSVLDVANSQIGNYIVYQLSMPAVPAS